MFCKKDGHVFCVMFMDVLRDEMIDVLYPANQVTRIIGELKAVRKIY